jgi:hypothetical protein
VDATGLSAWKNGTVADHDPAASCLVTLLVPHPSRTAVLVVDDADSSPPGPARMPIVRVPGEGPELAEILTLVEVVDPAETPVLRLVMTAAVDAGHGGSGAGAGPTMLVEFDSVPEPPLGWTWQDLDLEVIGQLEPETTRSAVAAWARERDEGWAPLRPTWSRPGWLAQVTAWIAEQMAADGRSAVEPPRQQQLWDLSVVLRSAVADGDVFFKCSADAFRHEGTLTRALAERMPGLVPDVIAIDGDQGWLLMRDLGAAELGGQDESLWHEGVVAHAGIQRSWVGRTDELVALGVPVRSLSALAAEVEALSDDVDLLSNLSADDRERWTTAAPVFVEACRRLDQIGPGPTLVHGDFHPWNVAYRPGRTRVFDWTDAAVSHPFVDLATYVFRTKDLSVRRRLVDAYVDAWSTTASAESLEEAVTLGLVVGALYQVQTYRALLPTLMAGGRDGGLAGADLRWIHRALAIHREGLSADL